MPPPPRRRALTPDLPEQLEITTGSVTRVGDGLWVSLDHLAPGYEVGPCVAVERAGGVAYEVGLHVVLVQLSGRQREAWAVLGVVALGAPS